MAAKVGYLVIDTVDPERLAPFWCDLLGVSVDMIDDLKVVSIAATGHLA